MGGKVLKLGIATLNIVTLKSLYGLGLGAIIMQITATATTRL